MAISASLHSYVCVYLYLSKAWVRISWDLLLFPSHLCSRLRLKGKMWEQTRSDNPKEKALVRLQSWTTPFLYFRWRTCRNRTGGSLEKWNMHVKFQSYKPTPSYPAKTEICSSSKIFLTVNQLWMMNYFSIILQLTGVLQEVRYFLQDNTCHLQTSASSCVENRAGLIQHFPPWMMLYECEKKKKKRQWLNYLGRRTNLHVCCQ